MNREHTREHMEFQLIANSHFTEEQLQSMTYEQVRKFYDYFVERVDDVAIE